MYSTVGCYCVGTNAITQKLNHRRRLLERHRHWHTAVTFSTQAYLLTTLFTCCFNGCRCWCNWCYCWGKSQRLWSRSYLHEQLLQPAQFRQMISRNKRHQIVSCYCIRTNTINSLSRWTIVNVAGTSSLIQAFNTITQLLFHLWNSGLPVWVAPWAILFQLELLSVLQVMISGV